MRFCTLHSRLPTSIANHRHRLAIDLHLPPYSPDLNRIEKCWGWLKSRIRKSLPHADGLRAAMETVLKQATS